ncbi:MAG: sensor histidine kinase [Spirochaetales bacterium]|uniref:histidine kinase n=1 Tax=Candidatus Thalassospirochaeta sargassi TaxID=3119039 RepID=A0AAJ1MNB9_9SPIO|nr:sensor histidine kinase [Spirochaetales bacterium]
MKYIIFTIFIAIELVEYFLDYPCNSRKLLQRILFLIRIIAVITAFLCSYHFGGDVKPFFFFFIPLLAFYSAFVMSGIINIIFIVVIIACDILLDVHHFEKTDIEVYYSTLIIFQRIVTIAIFYLFAYFWQTDIKKSSENEQLLKKLNKSEEDLRKYAREVARTSVLEERTRIARDMHDSVGHALTAVQMQLRKALALHSVDEDKAVHAIEAALEVAGSSLQDTRAVLSDLRDNEMHFSFEEKIEQIVSTLRHSGINVELQIADDDETFNYSSLVALFRFVQEGVTNIIKHSGATHTEILLTYSEKGAELIIRDDGCGFDVDQRLHTGDETGMGLHGLSERFELIRGSLLVESSSGQGTTLTAWAPRDPVRLIGEEDGCN